MGQLDLFAAAGAPASGRGVGPAPHPDELVAPGRRLPPAVRLGTSSWSFPGWRGLVYESVTGPVASRPANATAACTASPLLWYETTVHGTRHRLGSETLEP